MDKRTALKFLALATIAGLANKVTFGQSQPPPEKERTSPVDDVATVKSSITKMTLMVFEINEVEVISIKWKGQEKSFKMQALWDAIQ